MRLPWGKEALTLRGHTGEVRSLAVSADGNRLFSGSENTVKMWNVGTGKEALTLRGHTSLVTSLALSADGKRLFSGSLDKTIKVWDVEVGKETLTLRGHTGLLTSLAVSADSKRLFSGSGDGDQTIKVWDLEAMSALRPATGRTERVHPPLPANDLNRQARRPATGTAKERDP